MREIRTLRGASRRRLARSVGDRPTKARVRGLVAWIAGRKETESLKPIDKAILGMASKSSGRNESERRDGLESAKVQRPSPPRRGEGSMGRRSLTDAASHSGGVNSDSTMTRTGCATGEVLLVPERNLWSRSDL